MKINKRFYDINNVDIKFNKRDNNENEITVYRINAL